MGVLSDIGLWLWRLLPANPILVRVVSAGGKRSRHLWARVVYLVVLFVVMLVVGSSLVAYQNWDRHWLVRYTILPVLLGGLTAGLAWLGSWLERKRPSRA